ncbi:cell division cycle-associated 7-like protein-like [Scleropages formosus]|uniref:Cell division cycle-associated 7-like protein-like n=1 Tax=Scleropages formosus TaxID=113540 RepID=A0A0P7V675_SCLFO|nr:cell division cycle-associated 7-like protein-like [Scleropages formosus]
MQNQKAGALAEIFTSPSDEEDFIGFGVAPSLNPSADGGDCWRTAQSGKPVSLAACGDVVRPFTEDVGMNSAVGGWCFQLRGDSWFPQGLCFQSRFITDELVRIFSEETDSEEEEFEGFGWDGSPRLSSWMTAMPETEEGSDEDTGFYSEGESKVPARRRSSGLCVAFRFPSKKGLGNRERRPLGKWAETNLDGAGRRSKGRDGSMTPPSRWSPGLEPNEETEELRAQAERARNIEENKAMLAKLFADLNSMPELLPMKTSRKKRRISRKERLSKGVGERRNPMRSARPPERFAVEEPPIKELNSYQRVNVQKLLEVNEGGCKRKSYRAKRKQKTSRLAEDITEEELENVALASKDKIHDKQNGSTCHQCRQKTLDTKTGWQCPRCRGICNCSLCRRQDGRCATGALVGLARFYGHNNVREYLDSARLPSQNRNAFHSLSLQRELS